MNKRKLTAEYLRVFGLTHSNSKQDLSLKYKKLLSIAHPDRYRITDPNRLEAEELCKKIGKAYNYLKSSSKTFPLQKSISINKN